ncbi:MAG: hypothetical protein AB8H79_23980 [Myxococcota bacterium]
MLRYLAFSTVLLLAGEVGLAALSPVAGVSLNTEAHAADFTGRVKRIRIKKKRVGSGFRMTTVVKDDGDGSAPKVQKLKFSVCNDKSCVATSKPGTTYKGAYRSPLFTYDGATEPEGVFKLTTALTNSDGKSLGASQSWTMKAEGTSVEIVAANDVTAEPYISDLELTADECGNGRMRATITGADNEDVVDVALTAPEGLLDDDEGVITGTLKRSRATFVVDDADLGDLGKTLAASESAKVTLEITAYDEKGNSLGVVKTEATAKYGDILIDGVPLQFD